MTDAEGTLHITVNLEPGQARALVQFLRRVLPQDVRRTLEGNHEQVQLFRMANDALRVAFVKALGSIE
jgi:hypothetical protein